MERSRELQERPVEGWVWNRSGEEKAGSFRGKGEVQGAGAIACQACRLLVPGWCGRKYAAFLGQRH